MNFKQAAASVLSATSTFVASHALADSGVESTSNTSASLISYDQHFQSCVAEAVVANAPKGAKIVFRGENGIGTTRIYGQKEINFVDAATKVHGQIIKGPEALIGEKQTAIVYRDEGAARFDHGATATGYVVSVQNADVTKAVGYHFANEGNKVTKAQHDAVEAGAKAALYSLRDCMGVPRKPAAAPATASAASATPN